MAKSSEATNGDTIAICSDVLKLLAPVLKEATKDQIKGLKRDANRVQKAFRRMLEGEDPVMDYSTNLSSTRITNNTGMEFEPNLRFEIRAEAMGGYPDSFNVTLIIPGIEQPLWSHHFGQPINWLGHLADGFISLDQALQVKSSGQARQLRDRVQGTIIAEKASVLFFKADQADLFGVFLQIDAIGIRRTSYLPQRELRPLVKVM